MSTVINNAVSGFKGFQRWLGENVVGRGESDYSSPEDRKTRDFAMLGAATGALVGATIGTVTGFQAQAQDTIKERWTTHDVTHPHLTGYDHRAVPDYDRECHYEGTGDDRKEVCHDELKGWWHRFDPNVRNDTVGSYNRPYFDHTKGWQPLLGGFVGAAGGALVGLGLGIGANALRNAINKPDPNEEPVVLGKAKQAQLADFTGGAIMAGGAMGAGIGAYLGSKSGNIEMANQQVHTRNWMSPVTVRTEIGRIPADNYEYKWFGFWPGSGEGHGTQGVHRDVPQYNADGSVRMQEVSHEFKTGRYGPITGGIVGGIIGAGAGIATGAAVGLCLKMVFEKAAATQAQHGKDDTKPEKPPVEPPTTKAA